MENKLTFEEKLAKLNELVNKLQDNSISFEESVSIYNESIKLSEELKNELNNTLSKVTLVNENNEEEDF
ncbi:MAG: exodeoxyribonuclease VII small subunit [Erysipelotrichaceae bacterium]|nr:exodeoxyribonuclease VII small subunit [Erysipelotrichaceae bacterium]